MPELPEVQTIVRTLQPKLMGRKIDRVEVNRTDIIDPPGVDLAAYLTGRKVKSIIRRGKKIIFQLDDQNRFYIHLGMTGRLTVEFPGAPRKPHTHLILLFGTQELRFVDPRRFGGVWWLGRDTAPDEEMGPEPLDIRSSELAQRLGKTNRAIKSALLDQTLIAGLGNIYVDESLFSAGISPLTPANTLSVVQVKTLNRHIKATLRRAIQHNGSTLRDYRDADGNQGDFQKLHRIYHRAGQPCVICKSPIQRIVLGGRSTHFCVKCQPMEK